MNIVKAFTLYIPRYIKYNEWDERNRLSPVFLLITAFVFFICWVTETEGFVKNFFIALPPLYYVVLVAQLAIYEYDYDLSDIKVSEKSRKILESITTRYHHNITFVSTKMTKDVIGNIGVVEKISIVKEIKQSLYPHNFSGTFNFQTALHHEVKNAKLDLDTEFIELLIRELNMPINFQDFNDLKVIGVEF